MSDVEIISEILSGKYEFLQILIDRYMPLIINTAVSYEGFGVETEELIADGVLSIFSAVKTYDSNVSAFSTFASVCIKRSMLSEIRAVSAKKRIPKEMITSIDDVDIESPENPEDIYIRKESYNSLKDDVFAELSSLECKVLSLFVEGASYSEIGDKLGISVKTVDNALTRIRNKLKNNK